MTKYRVVLKNVHSPDQKVVIGVVHDEKAARAMMANFRRAKWEVERRPNLDTIDHVGLTFEKFTGE